MHIPKIDDLHVHVTAWEIGWHVSRTLNMDHILYRIRRYMELGVIVEYMLYSFYVCVWAHQVRQLGGFVIFSGFCYF
jgi:hypothetical protein